MPLIVHFPPPHCSILCLFLKCHSPYLAIANSTTLPPHFLIFTLSVLLSALVCAWAPIHIWKNRCSFSADNTNRYTSHLLQRLMSVIYHNPIMGFSVCARMPVCVCVCAPPYFFSSDTLSPTVSLFPSNPHICPSIAIHLFPSLPPHPLYSPPSLSTRTWSDPARSACVCAE